MKSISSILGKKDITNHACPWVNYNCRFLKLIVILLLALRYLGYLQGLPVVVNVGRIIPCNVSICKPKFEGVPYPYMDT